MLYGYRESVFASNAINSLSRFHNNCFYPGAVISTNGPSGDMSGNISMLSEFTDPGFHGDDRSGIGMAYRLSSTSNWL